MNKISVGLVVVSVCLCSAGWLDWGPEPTVTETETLDDDRKRCAEIWTRENPAWPNDCEKESVVERKNDDDDDDDDDELVAKLSNREIAMARFIVDELKRDACSMQSEIDDQRAQERWRNGVPLPVDGKPGCFANIHTPVGTMDCNGVNVAIDDSENKEAPIPEEDNEIDRECEPCHKDDLTERELKERCAKHCWSDVVPDDTPYASIHKELCREFCGDKDSDTIITDAPHCWDTMTHSACEE
jgi:hypothetical protein